MNGTVACGSCQASFSQLAELKHHNNLSHFSPVLSKGDFHTQSFSSAEEFFARNQSKRQSLFDGVPFPERKRKRIEHQVKSLEKSQRSTKDSNLRKFLLMFDCKTCHKKFSKLGEFRKHLESAHSTDGGDVKNDNDVPKPEDISLILLSAKSSSWIITSSFPLVQSSKPDCSRRRLCISTALKGSRQSPGRRLQ